MQREQEPDGEPAAGDVLKWEKMSGKGAGLREREERTCAMEERRSGSGCSSPHTPIPEGAAEWESALRKKRGSRWDREAHKSLSTTPVINSPAGLLESAVKCSSDSGVP